MENKIKVIAFFGKSASGKDTIQKWIVSQYPDITSGIVSCTTRPKRDYEINGKDYFFLNDVEFGEKVLNGSMLEATSFNGWFYGTPIEGLQSDKINIGVFNPEGISALLADSRLAVLPVYVYASDKTRLLRSLNREDKPNCYEICRRFFADEQDFADWDFSALTINNEKDFDTSFLTQLVFDFNYEYGQTNLTNKVK